MASQDGNARLVYSTESGKMCPVCQKAVHACTCRKKQKASPSDGIVRVRRETKGRKGKGVTLISGLPLNDEAIKTLAKTLKQTCGSGGTVKNGTIEIQGDHGETLANVLKNLGYTVKA